MVILNRLDPFQSIEGGSKNLAKLRNLMNEDIEEPDRTFMALAAYNVGRGHLEDARILAKRDGQDNTKWEVLKKYLPLLTIKKYYSTVTHGYARGNEPVRYVENILYYQKFLKLRTLTGKDSEESAKKTDLDAQKWKDNIPPSL